jgi:hypothetical protein
VNFIQIAGKKVNFNKFSENILHPKISGKCLSKKAIKTSKNQQISFEFDKI